MKWIGLLGDKESQRAFGIGESTIKCPECGGKMHQKRNKILGHTLTCWECGITMLSIKSTIRKN